jgi:hypothetical protein
LPFIEEVDNNNIDVIIYARKINEFYKPMKLLRKSAPITVILLGTWLSMAFSYSITVECSCCSHNDYQHAFSKKRCADQLSLSHKKHQEDTHHHQKDNDYHPENNNHHQDDNNCSCIKCGYPYSDEMLLKTYWMGIDKQQVLALDQDNFERKISLLGNIFAYLERKPNTKFLSLFLLNSSFLL